MLVEFRVSGFRNFKDELVLKLNQVDHHYDFSFDAISNQLVKTALLYGKVGSGKSNLGLAIHDITRHLTDRPNTAFSYQNLYGNNTVRFYYQFQFDNVSLSYSYHRASTGRLLQEELSINNERMIYYNHLTSESVVLLEGTEPLNKNLNGAPLSFVKYISRNSILPHSMTNRSFMDFVYFVENMKHVSSLSISESMNLEVLQRTITRKILELNKLEEFERFLQRAGLNYQLVEASLDSEPYIQCKWDGQTLPFFQIASNGTYSLAVLFYHLIDIQETSFLFIDQLDAFLDVQIAASLVKELVKLEAQTLMTTHHTSLLNNELLRPDCYFILRNGQIHSLSKLTAKELKKPHNLERMYRAGAFDTNSINF
jgi:AAA15 family ATPase/GTPase